MLKGRKLPGDMVTWSLPLPLGVSVFLISRNFVKLGLITELLDEFATFPLLLPSTVFSLGD